MTTKKLQGEVSSLSRSVKCEITKKSSTRRRIGADSSRRTADGARRVVAGTVANNVRWMAALDSECARQAGTVNLLHFEKNFCAKLRNKL